MLDLIVKRVKVGIISTNCYILKDRNSRDAIVIDPGGDLTVIQDAIHKLDACCRAILLTHGHFDHILAVGDLRRSDIPVCIHKDDAHFLTERDAFSSVIPYDPRPFEPADMLFDKEGSYSVAGFDFYVIHTPGHTMGSVCYMFGGMLFTGDTLFKGSAGTTDFGGSEEAIQKSLRMLYDLPGDYEIYPGHDEFSTLQDERENNPYMKVFARK